MSSSPRTLAVYCSSSDALTREYFEAAEELGLLIGQRGDSLVYGGGKIGLMGAVARAARGEGSRVVGVIPEKLLVQLQAELDEVIVTPDMRERKAEIEARADAFVTLPGGFGTLEEVLEIITRKQLAYHNKPIVFLNTAGFFDTLLRLVDELYDKSFIRPQTRGKLYHVATTAADVYDYLDHYQPVEIARKWY